MLTETAAPIIDQAVIDDLARHLKVDPNYGADAAAEMEGSLRAAVAHLESRLGLALLQRDFVWRGWLGADRAVTAPIGPVSAITAVDRVLPDGSTSPVDLAIWSLDRGALRTRFHANVHFRDQLDIAFTAGFGPGWTDTPADLRQAAFMLAAHFFDNRHATTVTGADLLPLAVKELVAPWRPVRIGLGMSA